MKEENLLYKKIIELSDLGYLYCKILLNAKGVPFDCEITKSSSFFEELFSQRNLVGKQLVPILEQEKTIPAGWLKQFTRCMENQEKLNFQFYSKYNRNWYDISITFVDQEYLIIYGSIVRKSLQQLTRLKEFELGTKQDHILKKMNKEVLLNSIILATNELLVKSNFYESVLESISIIGDAFKINRVLVFKYNDATGYNPVEKLVEWSQEVNGAEKVKSDYNQLPIHSIKELLSHLDDSDFLKLNTSDINNPTLKQHFIDRHTLSTLIIPIRIKNSLWGFICFEEYDFERVWLKEEINLLTLFVSSISNAIERKIDEDEREYLSYHDSLTGLYNRRFFEREFKRLDSIENMPISIIVADVNGLKLVNDAFGHIKGDQILQAASDVIITECRDSDIVARWGGDEFIILLPKTTSDEAKAIVRRISHTASQTFVNSISVSVSMASDTKQTVDEDLNKTLKNAEDLMYKHKLIESASIRGKTINAIIHALHEKNDREEQHSKRVSELCGLIGAAMSLSEIEIRNLKTIGLLHDIGKIAISDNILNKEGKLNEDEWNEIKRHSEIGYRILSCSNDMSEIADYVLKHHEQLDGSGYPNGLKGDEIPLLTRILSVADAYDAMSSTRPYRKALPEEVIISELIKNSCNQFDHVVVRVFIERVLKKPLYSVMFGVNNIVIKTGHSFDPLEGITVIDQGDKNLSINDIHITGTVNTDEPGDYTLTYTIRNAQGQIERRGRKISVGNLIETELLTDCNFQNMSKWGKVEIEGAQFDYAITDGIINVETIKGGINAWSAQLFYPGFILEKGKEYVVSFEASTNLPRKEIHVQLGWMDTDNSFWYSFLNTSDNKFYLTSHKQNYLLTFKMEEDTHLRSELKFEFGTGDKGKLFFENIKIYEFIR